jgi:hypothetical protein
MYACACVHAWMCVRACMYGCVRVCMYVCVFSLAPCAPHPLPRTRVCVRVCSCACARSRAAARTCVSACVPEFVRMPVCRLACAPICRCINESLVPPIMGRMRCAAPPAPAVAFDQLSAFALGSAGGTSCPSGMATVLIPAECQKAAGSSARPYGGAVRVYHWPPGCFWLTVGAGSFFFNNDFFPSSVYAQPVCAGAPGRCRHLCRIRCPAGMPCVCFVFARHGVHPAAPVAAPASLFTFGANNTNACPSGTSRMAVAEACEVAADAAGRPYGGAGALASVPAGCVWLSAGGGFCYNTAAIGDGGAGYSHEAAQPVCAGAPFVECRRRHEIWAGVSACAWGHVCVSVLHCHHRNIHRHIGSYIYVCVCGYICIYWCVHMMIPI